MIDRSTSSDSPIQPLQVAVLLSGSGRTLQNLADEAAAGRLDIDIKTVVSSRSDVYGVERASNLGLPCNVVSRKSFDDVEGFSKAVFDHVREAGADFVVLAGWLSLLRIPPEFANRVINVHPSLLPSFGGKGMYGHHVHEAVLEHGCKVSGCTVHLADDQYDTGPIVVQRTCPVLHDDTADSLAARVFEQETLAYPEALQAFAEGRVKVEGRRAIVTPGG